MPRVKTGLSELKEGRAADFPPPPPPPPLAKSNPNHDDEEGPDAAGAAADGLRCVAQLTQTLALWPTQRASLANFFPEFY
eukprot:SAG31_NODE_11264_length_1048_cov_1.370917_2_plen_79_part_01